MRRATMIPLVLTLLTLFGGQTLTAFPDQKEDEAALLTAAREGRLEVVTALLDGGVNVDARNAERKTLAQ